jgi:drug/metabolite transporter (DMT)-like permease
MANAGSRSRLVAILQAVLVVTLWSSSWVLIKFGLRDIPPLTFAGLRYVIAFLVLVPLALSRSRLQGLRRLTGHDWWRLTALGLLLYAAGVGMQFVALSYLPSSQESTSISIQWTCP